MGFVSVLVAGALFAGGLHAGPVADDATFWVLSCVDADAPSVGSCVDGVDHRFTVMACEGRHWGACEPVEAWPSWDDVSG